jgi:hypothetical protein
MIHPVFRLIARRPQLVAEHAQAYVALLSEQVGEVADSLKKRAVLAVAGLVALLVGLVLAGVAFMLWGATPDGSMRAPWALFVGPLLPLGAGIGCLLAAKGMEMTSPLEKVREQINADIGMLHEASTQ